MSLSRGRQSVKERLYSVSLQWQGKSRCVHAASPKHLSTYPHIEMLRQCFVCLHECSIFVTESRIVQNTTFPESLSINKPPCITLHTKCSHAQNIHCQCYKQWRVRTMCSLGDHDVTVVLFLSVVNCRKISPEKRRLFAQSWRKHSCTELKWYDKDFPFVQNFKTAYFLLQS